MIPNYLKALRGPKHPNLLREFLRERARIHYKMQQAGICPSDLLVRCLFVHFFTNLWHALKNVLHYWRGKLLPKQYAALVETTQPQDVYRTYDAA